MNIIPVKETSLFKLSLALQQKELLNYQRISFWPKIELIKPEIDLFGWQIQGNVSYAYIKEESTGAAKKKGLEVLLNKKF